MKRSANHAMSCNPAGNSWGEGRRRADARDLRGRSEMTLVLWEKRQGGEFKEKPSTRGFRGLKKARSPKKVDKGSSLNSAS